MTVPTMPIRLMSEVYRKVLPTVHKELSYWKDRASSIPDPELRKQALDSIEHKTFHCEGGGILALLAKEHYKDAIKFIVAYQTISDYLDNLCDRSTSLDPLDFEALHASMSNALSLNQKQVNYYRLRHEQDDDGYLRDLVATCQSVLSDMGNYEHIRKSLLELCQHYCDLQIHKHVKVEERVPRLQNWFRGLKDDIPEMEWYEFSACSGSTLGIFCLVSYGMSDDFTEKDTANIHNGYFPYIQGLHILLDYFIDQEEDRLGGDLNFCFYYESEQELFKRLKHFVIEADKHTESLPHRQFHRLINRGLLGIYLSDEKVRKQKSIKRLAREMIKSGGPISSFFYWNGRAYRTFQRWLPANTGKMTNK